MEVVRGEASARERKRILVPPSPAVAQPAIRRLSPVPAPHDEDLYRRFPLHPVFDALEPAVEPAQPPLVEGEGGFGREFDFSSSRGTLASMSPWPHDKPLRRLLGPGKDLPVEDVLAAPGVIPTRDMVDRHIGIALHVVDHRVAGLFPEAVIISVAHRLDEPSFVLGDVLQGSRSSPKGQVEQVLWHPLPVFLERGLELRVGQRRASIGRANGEDPVHEAKLEGAAVTYSGQARIGERVHRDHASEAGRLRASERVLGSAHVARAKGAHLAARPRLRENPLHDVVAVGRIIHDHPPLALGSVAPPDVVDDDRVALFAKPPRFPLGAALVVRSSREEDRVLPRRRGAIGGGRQVKVQGEPHPVPRWNANVLLDPNVGKEQASAGERSQKKEGERGLSRA